MRLPRVRFTVRTIMAGVAVCSVALAFLRAFPLLALPVILPVFALAAVGGPIYGFLRQRPRGERGIKGATIAGAAILGGLTASSGVIHFTANPRLLCATESLWVTGLAATAGAA